MYRVSFSITSKGTPVHHHVAFWFEGTPCHHFNQPILCHGKGFLASGETALYQPHFRGATPSNLYITPALEE